MNVSRVPLIVLAGTLIGFIGLGGCAGTSSEMKSNLLGGGVQNYVSLQTMTQAELTTFMTTTLGTAQGDPRFGTLPAAVDGTQIFKVTYNSVNFAGTPVTLSGAIALPLTGAPKGMVIYMHGTSIGQNECPSAGVSGANAYNEAAIAVAAFASGGYAVVMPDYVGQGVSTEAHPYVMGSKNAPTGRDLAIATYGIAQEVGCTIGTNLYVSGYSEGGGNAMALCQLLQAQPIPGKVFKAGATMSGPYDLSGAQRAMLMGPQQPQPDDLQFAAVMLTGDISHAANAYYGIKPNVIFKPLMASEIEPSFDGHMSNKDLVEHMAAVSALDGYTKQADGAYHLVDIMTPTAGAAMTLPDMNYPLIKMLEQYNTFSWTPNFPLYMVGLQTDTLVSFNNTINAIKAMRGLGVTNTGVNFHGASAPELNHLTAMPGLSILARRFLDGGFAAVPTDADPG